jgi:hypothetical protein
MALEVGAKTGAGYGEKNGFRLPSAGLLQPRSEINVATYQEDAMAKYIVLSLRCTVCKKKLFRQPLQSNTVILCFLNFALQCYKTATSTR